MAMGWRRTRVFFSGILLLLASCGFHLKGQRDLAHIGAVQLHSDSEELAAVLQKKLAKSGVQVSASAPITLKITNFKRRRHQAAIGRVGQSKELEFFDNFQLTVGKDGREFHTELASHAYLQYEASQYLGSIAEEKLVEQQLYQQDGDRVLRYLAAVCK